MTIFDDVAAQLRRELWATSRAVADLFGSDLAEQVELRLPGVCQRVAQDLTSDDDHTAAGAAQLVMGARWPDDTEPPPGWWRTPVGRMVARTGAGDHGESVTQSVAAAMLGVTRGTVSQWLHRSDRGLPGSGGLERHPNGGITRASVLAKLGERHIMNDYRTLAPENRGTWQPHMLDLAARLDQLRKATINPETGKPYSWNELGDAIGQYMDRADVPLTTNGPGRVLMWEARRRPIQFAVEWVEGAASVLGVDFESLAGSAAPFLLPGYAVKGGMSRVRAED